MEDIKYSEEFEPHLHHEVSLSEMDKHLISLHLFYSIPDLETK